jgi:NAD-dependent histone deacetylase SIR2
VRSISPPFGYPSPVSSQEQDASTEINEQVLKRRCHDGDVVPIAKKRRKAESTPRTTVHLDLTSNSSLLAAGQKHQCDLLLKVLRKRQKIVVVAGAGISVSAGSECFCFAFPWPLLTQV